MCPISNIASPWLRAPHASATSNCQAASPTIRSSRLFEANPTSNLFRQIRLTVIVGTCTHYLRIACEVSHVIWKPKRLCTKYSRHSSTG